METIKILHINSSIGINSGVMNVIMNYYRFINKDTIRFDFLYYIENEKNYKEEIKKNGGNYYYIVSPKKIISFRIKLDNFFKIHTEYKIIHLHDIFLAKIIYPIAKKYGIKLIIHAHSARWSNNKISGLRNKLMCINIEKYSDACFACSKAAGDFVYRKQKKYYLVKNAIDINKFSFNQIIREKIRKELQLDHKIVLGHVGRFSIEKNQIFLIEIMNKILNYNSNIVLLLVGDGPLRHKIEKSVNENNINNNVIFLGSSKNVFELYQAMDLFLLPSIYEGLPLVGVEAQISGLRCIMSSNVTNEVNLTDVTFLDLDNDIDKWVNIILEKIKMSRVENAQFIVEEKGFSIEQEAKKLYQKYIEILTSEL